MEERKAHRYSWICSNTVSITLLLTLAFIWYYVYMHYEPYRQRINTPERLKAYLYQNWESKNPQSTPIYIPTGIFVTTLSFKSPSDLFISGYIWQHYANNLPKDIKREFFLPDKLEFSKQTIDRIIHYPNEEVIQSFFEALIIQGFDFKKYPLDHKLIRLEIWTLEFNKNIVLVPDISSYLKGGADRKIGVDPDIILNNFIIQESYFGYEKTNYHVNFGLHDLIAAHGSGFPSLYFSIVLKRTLFNPMVAHVLPLVIGIFLMFLVLMMNTERKDTFIKFNFTGTMTINVCSVLFFVLVLAHASLRNEIHANQVVYLEYFYFLAYSLLILVVLNNYAVAKDKNKKIKFIHYDDNLIPKVLFWPCILLIVFFISVIVLF